MGRHEDIYRTKQWKNARQYVISRDQGLCVLCKKKGIIKPFKIIHHIVWLTDDNKYDWNIAYNPDNLECLCNDCHEKIHGRSIDTHLKDFIKPV